MQISENIHAIKIPFQIHLPDGKTLDRSVYSFIIFGEKICLIDSGVAGSEDIIFDYIKSIGRRPEEISLCVLTHAHPDHIGGLKKIKDTTGCKVAAHSADAPWIEDTELQFRQRPIPGFHTLVEGSVSVDLKISDGDILDTGGDFLKVIHTPGHSRGHVALLHENTGALFSGDCVPLPGSLPIYDDPAALTASINKLLAMDGLKLLLSAWDEPRRGKEVARTFQAGLNYLERISQVVDRVKSDAGDIQTLARKVLDELGLNNVPVTPLLVRTFAGY